MKITQRHGTGMSVTLKVLAISLLISTASVHAALIGIGSGSGLGEDSGGSTPEPIIDAAGRIGADQFKDLSASFGDAGMEKLAARAREVIKKQPRSGLAYEILGTVHYYQADFAEAEKNFTKASQLEPAEPGVWVKLGIVQMELNKIAQAEKSLTTALKNEPGNRIANQRLGLLYEYTGDVDKAITYLTRGMQGTRKDYLGVAVNLGSLLNSKYQYKQTVDLLKPRVSSESRLPEAHIVLGTALLQIGEAKTAEPYFAKAVELEPKNNAYHLGHVIALRKAGELKSAEKEIDKLLSKAANWEVAYLEKADIFFAQGQLVPAKRALDQALKSGAKPASVDRRLVAYHLDNKNFEEAKAYLEKLIKEDAGQPADYVRLSELARSQGGLKTSTQILESGIAVFPESGYLQFRYGSELAANRQYQDAEEALKKAAKLLPNDLAVLRAYSLTLAKNGNMKDAAEAAEKIYTLKPEQAEALFYATRLQANEQNKEAIKIYNQVLEADQNNIVALNNLATAHADEGDLKAAEKFAEKANSALPDNAQLQDTLGWILYKQKRFKEAAAILAKAADSAKDNAKIQYHAGMAYKAAGESSKASITLSRALELDASADWAEEAKLSLQALN